MGFDVTRQIVDGERPVKRLSLVRAIYAVQG